MSELTQKKVIPLIEEEVVVEKRSVDVGGVRITKHVREQEKIIDELLRKERISVERRPGTRSSFRSWRKFS
jgi:stress response protein YsnF